VQRFVANLQLGIDKAQVGLVIYSHESDFKIPLSRYHMKQDFFDYLEQVEWMARNTETAMGLNEAREKCFSSAYGARAGYKKITILITDGPAADMAAAAYSASLLKQISELYAIGFNSVTKQDLVDIIGSEDDAFYVPTAAELMTVFDKMLGQTCNIDSRKIFENKVQCRQIQIVYIYGKKTHSAL
jgi:hypothetical protein